MSSRASQLQVRPSWVVNSITQVPAIQITEPFVDVPRPPPQPSDHAMTQNTINIGTLFSIEKGPTNSFLKVNTAANLLRSANQPICCSPAPNLSQLKGLINPRLHRQLFFAATTTTTFSALYNCLPPSLHYVEITRHVLSAIVAADGEEGEEEEEEEEEEKGEEDPADPTEEEAACEKEEQDGVGLDMSGAMLALGMVDARPASL